MLSKSESPRKQLRAKSKPNIWIRKDHLKPSIKTKLVIKFLKPA